MEPRSLDTQALSGLAHPLRVQLFEQLSKFGPATATQLAQRLGESSGSTSYHLRQLERFGFVETDPDRGSGRERWWRRVAGGVSICPPDPADDPAGHAAARLVIDEFQRGRMARYQEWLATSEQWPREWREGTLDSSVHFALTAPEMTALAEELDEVIERWKQRLGTRNPGDEFTPVELQLSLFPLRPPD